MPDFIVRLMRLRASLFPGKNSAELTRSFNLKILGSLESILEIAVIRSRLLFSVFS
jgi:hypothetical protein